MIGGSRLLLSVPAGELARHVLEGSLLAPGDLDSSPVSAELADGLRLVLAACAAAGTPVTVVVRPEMFTHGSSLAWLRERVGDARHHLCFSDGEAVRVIPGLENHVFFYRAGAARSAAALLLLRRRAPELLGLIRSQINTAYILQEDQPAARPVTTLLAPGERGTDAAEDAAAPRLLGFFTSHGPVLRDAAAMAQQDGARPGRIGKLDSMTYVALNGTALGNAAFVTGLGNLLVGAYVDTGRGLVLQVPACDKAPVQPEDGIAYLLEALRRYSPNLPSGLPPNVFLHASGDAALPAALFAGSSRMVAHESSAFWRLPRPFYGPFGELTLLRDRLSIQHKAGFRTVVRGLTGRVWAEAVLPESENRSLARYTW